MFNRAIVCKMGADDPVDDERAERGSVGAAVLEIVERSGPDVEAALVAVVPLGHARVQVPAEVVEPGGVRDLPDLVDRLVFELPEADDHVGHLDTGVVDVVLRLDGGAAEAQHPHQRVAKSGIPQMTDMGGLVRVDGGVLDDGLRPGLPVRGHLVAQPGEQERRSIEVEIQVTVGRDLDTADARQGSRDRRRSPARWRAAACASVRASWKATVTARSPRARLGGTSMPNAGISVSANRRWQAPATASCTSR